MNKNQDCKKIIQKIETRGFLAKKSLGQNFLADANMQLKLSAQMLSLLEKYPDKQLIEVGPGQGDLTKHFLNFLINPVSLIKDKYQTLIAIEIDKMAIDFLTSKFLEQIENKKLLLKHLDIVDVFNQEIQAIWKEIDSYQKAMKKNDKKFDANNWLSKLVLSKTIGLKQTKAEINNKVENIRDISAAIQPEFNWQLDALLVSNLPYHIGSRMLIDLAVVNPQTPFAVVLQKEVVEKLTRNGNFNLFGAYMKLIYDFQAGIKISPQCFIPVPKVTSQLVFGYPKTNLAKHLSTSKSRLICLEILKKLLAFPNKTLANNLLVFNLDKKSEEYFWLELEKFFNKNQKQNQVLDVKKTRLDALNYQFVVALLYDLIIKY